jgi:hypothetical protein
MIEVLKQMVEALEVDAYVYNGEKSWAAIQAGKQAIAELENQEPRNVRERWNVEFDGNDLLVCFNDHEKGDKCQYERYSPQRTWVGLSEQQRNDIENDFEVVVSKHVFDAIAAKLKELNT